MSLHFRFLRLGFCFILFISLTGLVPPAEPLTGAWEYKDASVSHMIIFTENYFTHTAYDGSGKKFISSQGGTFQVKDNRLAATIEFNTAQKEKTGQTEEVGFTLNGNQLSINMNGKTIPLKRIDDGSGPLAGCWVITGRMQGDSMITITPGARKTLKIMSGSRFQWAAINTETKEFFGTGGGTYTFIDGKYTETIDFFSRDNSRVGMSLSFNGKLVDGKWHHSGLSSRGANIHEIWSRVN